MTLQATIDHLEKENTYINPSELFQAVADQEWAKKIGLKAGTVYQRVREFKITYKTEPGKRGGNPHLAEVRAQKGKGERKSRREKLSAFKDTYEINRKRHPSIANLITRAENGSLKASIKANCLICVGLVRKEVSRCTAVSCLWYPHRPYQGKTDAQLAELEQEPDEEPDNEVDEESEEENPES